MHALVRCLIVVVALVVFGLAAQARAASTPPARIAFDDPLSAPSAIVAATDAIPKNARVPVLARVDVDRKALEPDDAVYRFEALDARLAQYRDRQIPVWLTLSGLTASTADAAAADAARGANSAGGAGSGSAGSAGSAGMQRARSGGAAPASAGPSAVAAAASHEAWGRFVRALARHLAGRVAIVELTPPDVAALGDAATDLVAFDLKRAAIELHGADTNIIVAVGAQQFADVARFELFYGRDLAAYVDAVVAGSAASAVGSTSASASSTAVAGAAESRRGLDAVGVRTALDRADPTAVVLERGAAIEGDASGAWRGFISAELWRLGTASAVASYRVAPGILQSLLRQLPTYGDLLGGELARIDDASSQITIEPPESTHLLVYDTAKFATFLIYGAGNDDAGPVRISLKIASDAKPSVRDPLTGAKRDVDDFARDTATQRSSFRAPRPAAGQALIIDFNDSLGNVITERSEVKGKTALSVAEIIARHQQVQAAQDAAVRTYTVAARMEQHFRPAISDPGYDVVTENRFFVEDEQIEWEELSFSVNGSTWKDESRPPFPILQPEKVLSVPLKLRMTADYRYRLAGTESVDGHECYVIHFDPAHVEQSLYRGTVWIDTGSFVRRKLQAVQTKLSAPVVSNEETHHFEQVATLDGRAIILPSRITSHQMVLIAGRNLLVDKETSFNSYDINANAFSMQRQSARASNRIMYRDTDHGIRYLEKKGEERVVRDKETTSVKAIAMGLTLDPSYSFPLPILGLDILDFNFRGPDSQLALLFAGVLALGNIQRPKLFGTRLDGSVDFFAIAVPGSDRVYGPGGEQKDQALLTWPMFANANIGYQLSSFQKISAQYQFKFNAFVRDGRTTPETYTVPSSTVTHGIGLGYAYSRAGYSLALNGTRYFRMNWEPWGPEGAVEQTSPTYDTFSLNLSKDWYLGLFQKIHVNGAFFGGDRLDRFAQYQFGMFDDTKIHGVPSSGVRYGELTMARGSYSFNIFEQYRFDVFLEHAIGRDRTLATGTDWQPITGLGAAVNVRAPWNTILKVDYGKAFLPDRYRANGSNVIQILILKPLGKG